MSITRRILLSVNDIFYVQILAHICNAINFYFACRVDGAAGRGGRGKLSACVNLRN